MLSSDLPIKYRPTTLDEVVGQSSVVRSIKHMLDARAVPHAFLFHGPSGVGKTTIARIIAEHVKAQVLEVDAATYTGIDSMRALTEGVVYKAFGPRQNKCIIIDECQALSKQAWQSLLKIVEEPPEHVYFIFCTTEPDKVPRTIVTRTASYMLREVPSKDIENLLDEVVASERIKLVSGAIEFIVRHAHGSVRQALVSLGVCSSAKNMAEVSALTLTQTKEAEVIELFRLLCSGRANWIKCIKMLQKIEEVSSYESLRIGLVNYAGAALLRTNTESQAAQLASILTAFSTPFNKSTERAEFLLALCELLL